MRFSFLTRIFSTYVIGCIGGWIFFLLHLPLPWILGPITVLLFFKTVINIKVEASLLLRNISFSIMGVQIGGTFTTTTIEHVIPYAIPYTVLTLIIITFSLAGAFLITKWIPIDTTTSMLGSVPGGLSAIIALSESMKGNTVLVTIFHTIRLMTVLFVIPFAATHFFLKNPVSTPPTNQVTEQGPFWTVIIYVILFVIALYAQKRVPASLVVIPMLVIGGMKILDFPLYQMPNYIYLFAQLTLGIYLGNTIFIKDLVKAGRYCVYYFGLSLFVILLSFLFGYIFSMLTGMDLATAVLSFAPGGLVEMALTAQSVSGDPSVVSSLQTIRLLTIVLILPIVFQKLLPKLNKKKTEELGK